jgi:hypothetical protein
MEIVDEDQKFSVLKKASNQIEEFQLKFTDLPDPVFIHNGIGEDFNHVMDLLDGTYPDSDYFWGTL